MTQDTNKDKKNSSMNEDQDASTRDDKATHESGDTDRSFNADDANNNGQKKNGQK
jgi:hypothetical protein